MSTTQLAGLGAFFAGIPFAITEIAKRTDDPVVLICGLAALLGIAVSVVIGLIVIFRSGSK